jgi:hypothetical protein
MSSSALLQRFIVLCLATLCANVFCAITLPHASGRIVGAVGASIAAALLFGVGAFPDVRNRLLASPPALLERRATLLIVLVPFLLPGLFLHVAPVLGFWRFDGRAALLVAWLAVVIVAIILEHRRGPNADRRTVRWLLSLFILFSAGVWLSIVLDSGIASFMVTIDRRGSRPCQSDPFTTMITIWESNPPSEHLFLGWRSQENFDHRIVYANHVHPYLLTMYTWIAVTRYTAGLTSWGASNTSILLPILVLIAAFGTLLARSGLLWNRTHLRGLLTLFLAIGILVTTWRLWIDLVRFNSDNPYPLLSAVFVLFYALLLPPARTGGAAAVAAVFVALSPVYTPMLVLPVLCLFGHSGRTWREVLQRNRSVMAVCAVALLTGGVAYLEPRLLIWWKGYQSQESSFLFRSGLDGDTSYFSGLLQAAVAPCPTNCCYGRTVSELLFPAILPLAAFGPLTLRHAASTATSVWRAFLFLATPYLVSVILFPQSVSVHPYLYDHLFVIAAVVAGLMAMLSAPIERRLTGAGLLAFLLLVSAILMSNLIGIAQGLARAEAYFTQ